MLFKIAIPVKDRAILSYQNIASVAMYSLVMYSNCFEWNFWTVLTLFMLLLKGTFVFNAVYYCNISLHYKWWPYTVCGIIFAVPVFRYYKFLFS